MCDMFQGQPQRVYCVVFAFALYTLWSDFDQAPLPMQQGITAYFPVSN